MLIVGAEFWNFYNGFFAHNVRCGLLFQIFISCIPRFASLFVLQFGSLFHNYGYTYIQYIHKYGHTRLIIFVIFIGVGKYRKAVSSFPSQRVPKEVTRPSGELPGPKPTKKKTQQDPQDMGDEIKANCSNTTGFANTQKKKDKYKDNSQKRREKRQYQIKCYLPPKTSGRRCAIGTQLPCVDAFELSQCGN